MTRRPRFPWPTPYVVAAIDHNHDGRLAQGRRLVSLAALAGASAVKVVVSRERQDAVPGLSAAGWRDLRREARHRLHFVVAPHDAGGFADARGLRPDAYQIDPEMLSDVALLRAVARERRPVFVVAGACTTPTLRSAVKALGSVPVVVLHTVAAPALEPARARLRFVPWLAARLGTPVGYLGLETGEGWATVAAALGAVVIEKRLTLDHALPGAAHAASLDPSEFRTLVTTLRDLERALEPVRDRRVFAEELPSLERSSRSLVVRRSLRRGHVLRPSDVIARPGGPGLSPRLAGWLTGRRLKYDVEAGDALTFGLVDIR